MISEQEIDLSFSPTIDEKKEKDDKEPQYTKWIDIFKHWPWTTLCIVSNEFCERFSYYGMRTVLTLYLLNVLKFNDRVSTVFFNGFTVLCYLTPILGAVIADGFIGMFWTILSISLLYALGEILLAIAAIQNSESSVHPWLDLLGLVIIAFGTGGIKPCVAPFGAEQFNKAQVRMISIYFSMFYFAINAGSMISTFISPLMRSISCMGEDSCYPLAFGLPAILMVIATVAFAMGSFWYKKPKVKDNVFAQFAKTFLVAIRNKFRYRHSVQRVHWLEHFLDTHKCDKDQKCLELKEIEGNNSLCHKVQFVEDVKSMIQIGVMFLPVPMFWALYDQQGSIWTIQAIQMDCRLWGDIILLPDQMQTMNAVLILVFIPIFQAIIYPLVAKCYNFTPLRKMVVGGLLAALSFVCAGFIQLQINTTLPNLPKNGETYLSFMNTLSDCTVDVTVANHLSVNPKILPPNHTLSDDRSKNIRELFSLPSGIADFDFSYNGTGCSNYPMLPYKASYDLQGGKIQVIILNEYGTYLSNVETNKPTNGNGEFGLMVQLAMSIDYRQNLALCRVPKDLSGFDTKHPCDPRDEAGFIYWETDYDDHTNDIIGIKSYEGVNGTTPPYKATQYQYKAVRPGRYSLYYMYNYTPKSIGQRTMDKYQIVVNFTGVSLEVNNEGGVLLMVLTGSNQYKANKHIFQVVPNNKISIMWQTPQYVIITAAEILFSITGYELAYSQAAPSMKSIVQAFWLLTSSVGDSIIVLIALWNPFTNVATEMFAYAVAMVVVMIIFALLATFYFEYNYYTGEDSESGKELSIQDYTSDCLQNGVLPNGSLEKQNS